MNTGWNFYKDQYNKRDQASTSDYKYEYNEINRKYAELNNKRVLNNKTKFKINDIVLLEGKHVVVITEVQPMDYITVPSRYSCYGSKKLDAVKRDVNVYRYKHLGKNYSNNRGMMSNFDGQTTEDRLSFIKGK